ncbi:MAG: hypothetical protein IK021_04020 [Methanobrevibacter sp.]|nr:hypothetical protein [Methanobrevibacter sp.]
MIMDILLICECFLIIALIVFLIATLRIITYKSISMGLIGTSSFTLALTLLLVTVGTIYNIGFFKDIALSLLLLGIVGTIAYAAVMRRAE